MNEARILVVDDEVNLTRMVKLYLEQVGHFRVREENRSTDAVAAALDFRPDLILLDVDMPDLDGGEVARRLKAQPELCDVVILFYSALVSNTETNGGKVMRGGHRFLAKPVNPGALVAAVKVLLCERTARRANGEANPAPSRIARTNPSTFSCWVA